MTRRYRDVTDEDCRIARDGEMLRFPMALMDNQSQPKDSKMTTEVETVVIDGATMSKDSAIEHLQGKIAALESQTQVQDAIAVRDATRLRARDALLRQQAAKHNGETAHGAYVAGIRDAWKAQPAR